MSVADARCVGWRERIALPDLGIALIKAKMDTGARTSALHATSLTTGSENGERFAYFDMHPSARSPQVIACRAPIVDERRIRDSGGHDERRYIIQSRVRLGSLIWSLEFSLTDRNTMRFPVLIGRTGMNGLWIDPGASYTVPRPE